MESHIGAGVNIVVRGRTTRDVEGYKAFGCDDEENTNCGDEGDTLLCEALFDPLTADKAAMFVATRYRVRVDTYAEIYNSLVLKNSKEAAQPDECSICRPYCLQG